MPKSLQVRSLTHSYTANGSVYPVFENVSFELDEGTILGCFGPNGSGKSTLVRTIAESCRRNAPSAQLIDEAGEQVPIKLGIVPQQYDNSFFPWASLLDNIRLTLPDPIANWRSNAALIQSLAAELEIDTDLRRKPLQCSGGMKQSAAIVRAFAGRPQVLLADEPFSALDVNVSRRLRQSVRRFAKRSGIISILVLHEPEEIVQICDKVLVIPGRPFYTQSGNGVAATILENRRLEQLKHRVIDGQSFVDIAERLLAS